MITAAIPAKVRANFQATPASVGLARDVATRHVRSCGLGDDFIEQVALVVSELVTNAIEATGPTERVGVYVAVEARHVVVAAADPRADKNPEPSTPVRSLEEIDAADGTEFGGWGLGIIESVAERVWVQPAGLYGAAGKWVCASLRLPDVVR